MIYEKHETTLLAKIQAYQAANQMMPLEERWTYFIKMAEGLQYLNNMGFIHRCLHSKRIYFTGDGELKIANCQWIRRLDQKEVVCQVYYNYMQSPEQLDNRNWNGSVDVWALGIMLYEMCTWKVPF